MPFGKWKDFNDCVQDMISQGHDEESARKICGALQARLGKESFSWVGDIKPHEKNLIRGQALHPIKTFHPEEWPSVRIYLEEELQKAAHTLAGAPLLLDHIIPIDGKVLGAHYEDGAIEYIAEINDPQILDLIRKGEIKHCSVEYDWSSLENVNGVAPKGLQFTGLALLKNFQPGDPETTVEPWEMIISKLKEAKSISRLNTKKEWEKTKESEWDTEYINNLPDDAFAYIEPGGEKDEQGKTVPRSLRHFPYKNAQGNLDHDHIVNGLARLGQDLGDWATEEVKAQIRKKLCAAARAWNKEHPDNPIESEVCQIKPSEESVREQELTIEQLKQRIQELEQKRQELYAQADALWDEIDALRQLLQAKVQAQVADGIEPPEKVTELKEKIRALQEERNNLKERVKALEKEKTELTKKLGEAVIEPGAEPQIPEGYILKDNVIQELKSIVFERVPRHWGYGPYEQNRRIKSLISRLEGKN
ncbi:MAG: hypothetical protein DRI26_05400 [Chloroflexi bacterium]|nr:MAG: hypothetical protein DRI26_05400 [Chloroflexota bacterium]